jgi:hypothetical protein
VPKSPLIHNQIYVIEHEARVRDDIGDEISINLENKKKDSTARLLDVGVKLATPCFV